MKITVFLKLYTAKGWLLNTGYLLFDDKEAANKWLKEFKRNTEALGISDLYSVCVESD